MSGARTGHYKFGNECKPKTHEEEPIMDATAAEKNKMLILMLNSAKVWKQESNINLHHWM